MDQFPEYHSWPFMYTIQSNVNTKERQMTMWKNLILDYAKSKGAYSLTLNELYESNVCQNKEINRRLKIDAIRQITDWMVQHKFADWTSTNQAERDSIFIYWRSPGDVAKAIFAWAKDGGRIGSIETVLDLIEDDLNSD